ncbi:MAG: hypothetical protein ACRETG_04645 [Steroidobacteraceae bacterium]
MDRWGPAYVEAARERLAQARRDYPWTKGMVNMPALPSNEVSYKTILVSNPGAGLDWSQVVPVGTGGAGKWWLLYAVYAQLVQGATQTPQPLLQFDDGTGLWMESTGSTTAQAASTTVAYSWAPNMLLTGLIGSGANVHANAPIPDSLVFPAGYHIKTSTVGIGANSQWQNIRLMVAELGN